MRGFRINLGVEQGLSNHNMGIDKMSGMVSWQPTEAPLYISPTKTAACAIT